MSQRELEEKMMAYRMLEARGESLLQQRDALVAKMVEIESTLQSIEEIEKTDSTILFPIGGEAYSFGKVSDSKKFVVEIGAGVALEKTSAEAKEILQKRKAEMQKSLKHAENELESASMEISRLVAQIQHLSSGDHTGHKHE